MTGRRKKRRDWARDIEITREVINGATLGKVGLRLGVTREFIRHVVQRSIESAHELSHYSTDPRWKYRSPGAMRAEAAFWRRQMDKLEAAYVPRETMEVSHG